MWTTHKGLRAERVGRRAQGAPAGTGREEREGTSGRGCSTEQLSVVARFTFVAQSRPPIPPFSLSAEAASSVVSACRGAGACDAVDPAADEWATTVDLPALRVAAS